jgi:phenylpyruvate C(3)-methyltransferase
VIEVQPLQPEAVSRSRLVAENFAAITEMRARGAVSENPLRRGITCEVSREGNRNIVTFSITNGGAPSGATAIFNSAVAAWAIAAAWEVGALDELDRARELDAAEFAACHDLDQDSTLGMFRALATVNVVTRENTMIKVSSNFDEVYQTKSFFHWLSRGTAELFQQMPLCLGNKNRVGGYYRRDSEAIAYACREINELCYASTFWSAMDRLGFEFGVMADLGCGSGARVIDILHRYPGTRGIGIDIAPPPLKVAQETAASAGLADRAVFMQGDVLNLEPRPEFAEVELITCFMMGHDFWPRENCVATLRSLREKFPSARRLLLGDATRTVGVADQDLTVFTVGFELGHSLMGVSLPTISDWEQVFGAGGWRLVATNRIEVAVGEVIFELA